MFPEEGAKLSDEDNGIGRWIKKQLNTPKSPLYGWNKGEIREAIDRLKRTGEQASSSTEYPLTLADVPDWLLHLLRCMLPALLSASLVLIGENSVGKTSLAMMIAFAFSRWHIRSQKLKCLPSVRVTQDIDFLKSKTGCPEEPVIYDDGDVWGLRPTQLKALLDVQARAPMVRARYTAAKFSAGQLRIVCDNSYDKSVAEDLTPGETDADKLWSLVTPAFHPEVRGAHIGAIFKRACFLVNTPKYLVAKLAGKPTVMVYPIPVGMSYMKEHGPVVLEGFFKDGDARADFDDFLDIEAELMLQCLGTKTIPALPALETVVPPPDFKDMSWHQVRTYIEAGYEAGKPDPYPRNYPAHLKWVSEEEQARINMRRVLDVPLMDSKNDDERRSEYIFKDAGVKESDDSQSLPDSEDSFWAPVVTSEHAGLGFGHEGASSSMMPPPPMVKDEDGMADPAEAACDLEPTEPFPWPPSNMEPAEAFDYNQSPPSMQIEEDNFQDGDAFSQPPIPEDFLGVDWFEPEDAEQQELAGEQVDSELERELVEALEGGDQCESD